MDSSKKKKKKENNRGQRKMKKIQGEHRMKLLPMYQYIKYK
jgi:hypothetical protein